MFKFNYFRFFCRFQRKGFKQVDASLIEKPAMLENQLEDSELWLISAPSDVCVCIDWV
jgi:hypothetical protein